MSLWTDLLGAEVRFYQSGPWRTRCIEAGTGTPLILIHGGGGHAEAYAKNVIPLSEYFHVYAIDALAHGLTTAPLDIDVTSATQVEHVRLFMDAAGIERAHLAGESMGGNILARFAHKYPERVIKFVSICGAGFYPPEGKSAQEEAEMADQAAKTRAALANPTVEGLRPRLEWLFKNKSLVTDELCETRARIYAADDYQEFQRRASARQQQGPARGANSLYDILPELGRQVPTLYLWTEDNPGTHVATAKRAQEITPNSEFIVMSDCGHWPQYEDAEEFNRILVDFLTK